jgi:hypothetical protein
MAQSVLRSICEEARLPLRLTPSVISEVSIGPFAEVDLGEPKHLLLIQMVDVDTNVSYQLRSNIPMVLLDVRDPVVRRIGFAFTIAQDENRSSWREFCRDLGPVSRTVVFVGSRRISSPMVNLVEPSVRIGSDNTFRTRTNVRICGIDQRVAIGDDRDHILAAYGLLVLISQRSSVPKFLDGR